MAAYGGYVPISGSGITAGQKTSIIALIEQFRNVMPMRPSLTRGLVNVPPNLYPEFDEFFPGTLEQVNVEVDALEAAINSST